MPRFPVAHSLLLRAIRDHAFPGAAYGVLLRDEVLAIASAGRFTYQHDSSPILPATIFDLASVSKAIATTAMAMSLWECGKLDLDAPIFEILPEFVRTTPGDDRRRGITARMLLSHSSGLPAYARLFETSPNAATLLEACLQMPMESNPGTQAVYSDIGFILLGHLLETIAGERLDTYCHRESFTPLGMASTMYVPPQDLRPSIPPTALENPLRHRTLQGEVHDDNCFVLGGISGHAGLFSNVGDILRFAACILGSSKPLFRADTVSLFTARCPTPQGTHRALGWDTPSNPSSSGEFFSPHSAGHLGYTGTSLWIDFDRQLAVVLLTNRTFPGNGPEGLSDKIQQVRPRFHDALMTELKLSAFQI